MLELDIQVNIHIHSYCYTIIIIIYMIGSSNYWNNQGDMRDEILFRHKSNFNSDSRLEICGEEH